MKKITLAMALCSMGLSAQSFPNPYCGITDGGDVVVEEITTVNFASTLITNADATSVLIDKTSVSIDVTTGQVYTLQVSGDTKGAFESKITAFIDWNDNGVLDDIGEIYEVGVLTNSNGSDAVSVNTAITVPSTTTPGPKRVRISKIYTDEDSEAVVNPCAISFTPFGFGPYAGYGQALDFTINVMDLSAGQFDRNALAIYPVPAADKLTVSYKESIESLTIYNLLGQEVYTGRNLGVTANIDVSKFSSGTYLAKITSTLNSATVKFIKK